jgi:molecular chaperone GrpE
MTSDQRNLNNEFGMGVHGDEPESVEDFIKELEAKEKDLHISSELVIEVEDSDFDDANVPQFVLEDMGASPKPAVKRVVPKPVQPSTSVQTELSDLKQKVKALIIERADLQEKSLKRMNEFENFKNRMERERNDTFKNQLLNLATQMLPVLDNLNRALDFASELPEDKRAEIQEFFDGIVLVNQQVNDVFAGMGVQPIAAVGEEFDPNLHDAVSMDETGNYPANSVTDEFLKGYRLGDRVVRHSMVKVAKAPPPARVSQIEPELSTIEIGQPAEAETDQEQ